MRDRDGDAALGRAVELGERDTRHVDGLARRGAPAAGRSGRWSRRRRAASRAARPRGAFDHAPDLRELLHQVRLRVQPPGRVDEDDVRPRASPRSIASKATAPGFAPSLAARRTRARRACAQISSCSTAAARNVSAAARMTDWPLAVSRSSRACRSSSSCPVPLTPTTRTTVGLVPSASVTAPARLERDRRRLLQRLGADPPAWRRRRSSSRRTISTVAGTPTSAPSSASSSRSQTSSSAGSKTAEAELARERRGGSRSATRAVAEKPGRSRPRPPTRPALSPRNSGPRCASTPRRRARARAASTRLCETPSAPIVTP